jgi:hypothetical protein
MTIIRRFNSEGIKEFQTILRSIQAGELESVHDNFLFDDQFSRPLQQSLEIENKNFSTRYDAAVYLHTILGSLKTKNKFYDMEIWSWLAAFYFNQLCPPDNNGKRKPKSDYRYILNSKDWDRIFRHLLAGPVIIYDFHKENSKLFLSNPLNKSGDFVLQLMGRQEIATNKAIIEVANKLYWDPRTLHPKRGASSKDFKPGTLRRFTLVLSQLELTYDLQAVTPEELALLLPLEFEKWLKIG